MNDEFNATWPEQAPLHTPNESPVRSGNVPMKQIVTIRLDIDMLNWFKSAGPGYQTRINQILRDHMDAAKAEEAAR